MQLQHVHKKLKNKNEITIIKKYDYIAKRYTVIITSKKIFINFWIWSYFQYLYMSYQMEKLELYYNILVCMHIHDIDLKHLSCICICDK